jgi:transcriptional regulator with XRE-family HTH domain
MNEKSFDENPNVSRCVTPGSSESASQFAAHVGRRMREMRLLRGLSQKDVGEKLGVSYQQIQKYETGVDAISLYRLLKLASLCSVAPESFWEAAAVPAEFPGDSSTDILKLIRAYNRIPDLAKHRLLRLVMAMAREEREPPEDSPLSPAHSKI